MSKPAVITIGHFDGVHVGHQRLLLESQRLAQTHNAEVVALAFDPHPVTVLRPDGPPPPRLMSVREKIAALLAAGADQVEILTPAPDLLALSPQAFIQKLIERHHLVAVVEGANFRFGAGRGGDVELLTQLGGQHGFAVHIVEPVTAALSDQLLMTVSSSMVRWLIAHGRMADAAICLGRPYELTACVVEGQKRGRTLNAPTANLDVNQLADQLIPAPGVYAGAALIESPETAATHSQTQPLTLAAAISVGVKPTFGRTQLAVEAHLLDYDGDLYGKTITLQWARWLRDQQSFASLDHLAGQIRRDIDQTRQWRDLNLLNPRFVTTA